MNNPNFFGIRHLSPAGAYYLRGFLDERKPRLVLVEGPSDFGDMLSDIVRGETKPPIAVLAYTKEAPVRTVLYPFAEYSPEYQAIQWCHKHQVECRFMDLPSETFLAIPESGMQETEGEEGRMNVYEQLDRKSGGDGHDTFWERVMEQAGSMEAYHLGANSFGANIRSFTEGTENDWAETALREAYMRRQIRKAVDSGVEPQDIVVVTGSYHVEGLKNWRDADEDLADMPKVGANHTLMPYSYYRLSTRAGYGAGNKAPAYYALLWEGLNRGEPMYAVYSYLIRLAEYQRGKGNPVSSASVIEAVRLAMSLAQLRGGTIASLRDLRDAAETCLGEGSVSNIILATADTEIGTAIGALPDGVSRTSIQEDFYRQLKDLKLEKYRDITAQDLMLDLRENRRVSSEKSAFIDLHPSAPRDPGGLCTAAGGQPGQCDMVRALGGAVDTGGRDRAGGVRSEGRHDRWRGFICHEGARGERRQDGGHRPCHRGRLLLWHGKSGQLCDGGTAANGSGRCLGGGSGKDCAPVVDRSPVRKYPPDRCETFGADTAAAVLQGMSDTGIRLRV